MKNILTLSALIIGFISFTSMQTANLAEFKFDADTFDFGKIPQNKPVTHEFKFTNTGDQPLIISEVTPACGCTAADYTKTPVKKGQSGSIKLTYNAAAPGVFSKSATIKSNSKTAVILLTFKGEVVVTEVPKG